MTVTNKKDFLLIFFDQEVQMTSKMILIAEDEQKTREGLRHTLETWNDNRFEIKAVENGEQALAVFQSQKVHLFLMDIVMPEINGLELLTKLKKQQLNPTTLIISSYSEFHYAQEAIHLGVTNYLVKPIKKQKLIEAIEEALHIEVKKEKIQLIEEVVDRHLIQASSQISYLSPIEQAIKYIKIHYKESLSLRAVAEYVHLNPNYLSVLFKEEMGITFSEYVTRSKIQEAKRLLVTTRLSINEISEAVGYQTTKYFIKIFKEYVGVTPAKYRKQIAF